MPVEAASIVLSTLSSARLISSTVATFGNIRQNKWSSRRSNEEVFVGDIHEIKRWSASGLSAPPPSPQLSPPSSLLLSRPSSRPSSLQSISGGTSSTETWKEQIEETDIPPSKPFDTVELDLAEMNNKGKAKAGLRLLARVGEENWGNIILRTSLNRIHPAPIETDERSPLPYISPIVGNTPQKSVSLGFRFIVEDREQFLNADFFIVEETQVQERQVNVTGWDVAIGYKTFRFIRNRSRLEQAQWCDELVLT